MTDLLDLSEREDELVPEIMPVDARLSFSAQAHTLVSLFSSAMEVIPPREIIPHTTYARVVCSEDEKKVEISATDGERAISLEGPALVRMSGEALLPAKRMLDILRLAPENTVRVDVIGSTATIRSGRAVWTVQTPHTEATLPVFTPEYGDQWQWANVERAELLNALELVLPAVARTTARQSLMQAEISKSQITSCDGVRAHRMTVHSLDKSFKSTLPLKFIETSIKELRASEEENVTLRSTHSTVILTIDTTSLYSQRLHFDFPAVNHLVLGPALQNEERLTVSRRELISSIRRVRVNADPEYLAIFLSIHSSKDGWNLIIRARDRDGNASQESIEVTYEGPDTRKDLALNHRYLLDFLACMEGDEVELRLGEATKAKQSPLYYESEGFVGSLMVMAPNFIR